MINSCHIYSNLIFRIHKDAFRVCVQDPLSFFFPKKGDKLVLFKTSQEQR